MNEDKKEFLESRKKELSEKYSIDFEKLEKEQIALARDIVIENKFDIELIEKLGAVINIFIRNKILSCFIVCDKNFEVIDKTYIFEKVRFPYFPGFRNYRELPSIMKAFEKLKEKPDVIFIEGQGIIHPRLGLASHFGLSTGIPTIGVSNSLVDCETKGNDGDEIIKNKEKVGKVLIGKEGSKPLYISPGNNISIDSSYKISKEIINPPHKRPEPLHIASKYAKNVRKEIGNS